MLELLSTLAAVGTFVVIAATAFAAIVQLRQLRTTHQLQGLLAVLSMPYDPTLAESFAFVSHELTAQLQDPEFRRDLEKSAPDRAIHKELRVSDYYERLGSMIKFGLFDEDLYFDNSSPERAWQQLSPVIAIMRRKRGNVVYDNFEYLVARSREWDRLHPRGGYPPDVPRLTLEDPWLETDRALATSGAGDEPASRER